MKNFNSIFNQLTAIGKRLAMVLTMLLTVGIGSVWGAEYTITFKSASSDSSSDLGASPNVSNVVSSGASYVASFSGCSKMYVGKSGIKLGSGSTIGTMNFTLATNYQSNIKSIKVVSAKYGSDTGTLTLYNGSTSLKSGISPGTDYTHTFSSPTKVTSLKLATSSKRAYITKIVITTEETATCTTNPTVSAGSHSNVTTTTATVSCSGGITSLGSAGCSIENYGFVYGTSTNPTISNTKVQVGTTYTTTSTAFTKELTGLTANTTYYVRPYATNGNGTAYGTQTSFKTLELPKYTVTLKDDDSELTQSTVGGSVTLPSRGGCDGYEFVGWTNTWTAAQITWTTTAPAIINEGSYTPTADVNLYPVYTKTETTQGTPTTKTDYVLTNLADIKSMDVVVITSKNSSNEYYAMSNNNGTGSAPTATSVTVSNSKLSSTPNDNLKWNISNNNGNLTIYPNGTTATWLYCTSTNNGVRVGTNANKTFTIDSSTGYLKHTGTSRYLGVYNKQDWRCYTNTTGNTANQTFHFFVETTTTTTTSTTTTSYISTPDCGTPTPTPTLNVDPATLTFENTTTNTSTQKTFTLTGSNLTANASLQLSGINPGMFSLSSNSVTQSAGSINQTITVTYTPTTTGSHNAILTISSTGAESKTVTLSGTGVAQTANYTVKHYQQNITDDNYTLKETETLSGEVGTDVTPAVKSYEGFTAPTEKSVEITANGNAIVEYQYARNSYTLTWDLDGGTITTAGTPEGAVKYGASLTAPVVVKDGFNFKGWDPTPSKMPAADATYTAQWKETYTVTLLNHGENYGENIIVEAGNPVALPTTKPTSCDTENYPNFFGWTETPIAGVDTKAPYDLITADFTPERSMILHAVFVDQLPQEGGWQVVTSASELVAGKIYTIGSYGSPDSGVAMGTQNNNNRGTTSWTTGTPVELTLGGATGAWTLYDPVEEGYLYAASSSYNYLKTQTNLNDNGRWAITISSNKAKIQAKGENTRNIIRYNSSSSIFSCYASGQGDIQLLTKAIGNQPTAFITSCCETEAPTDGFIDGVKGSGNAMSVTLYWKDANDYKRYHVVCDELGIDEDVENTNFQTKEVLSECTTYIFKVSSAPKDGCESPVLEIEATPFIQKTIAFVDGDNTTEQSTTCDSQSITVPTPTAQNCSTYVWKDEATGTEYAAGQTITPANDMTIVAKWSVSTYTINFKDWDDTVLQTSTVECGQMPTPPTDPTRPEDDKYKYTFAGWDPSIEEADGNQTYTATYDKEAHPITVIWMVNGEEYTLGAPSTMVSAGEKVAKLPTPPNPDDYCGQVFAGWTDQPINGAPITDAPAVLFNTLEASPTLYKEGDKTTATFYAVFADIKE